MIAGNLERAIQAQIPCVLAIAVDSSENPYLLEESHIQEVLPSQTLSQTLVVTVNVASLGTGARLLMVKFTRFRLLSGHRYWPDGQTFSLLITCE
jgi:hypothetical protein